MKKKLKKKVVKGWAVVQINGNLIEHAELEYSNARHWAEQNWNMDYVRLVPCTITYYV